LNFGGKYNSAFRTASGSKGVWQLDTRRTDAISARALFTMGSAG
jgi:hypothetical protein